MALGLGRNPGLPPVGAPRPPAATQPPLRSNDGFF